MNLAPNCPIDLDTLMQTRMLLVAGSGGGKSYALRKLLEETATGVQQFVIDPEGEFASLREKHDYIYVAAKDGDVVASPKTAGVLAHRLLELGTSAILDLYELRPDERQRFVKHFFDALVNAPRELWHPVMVVLDEAHMFCPQNGSAEAMQSVIDVASRGRKKGLALVLATQRISKLHKDTAAEMQNKMLGLTTLDVDRRRVAEELGMTVKEAVQPLRQLERGEFFVFGPALTRDVTKIKVGKVKTTHASGTGNMARTAPAPSASVKKMLVKLTDLDEKAAHEARTMEELKAENKKLRAEARKPTVDDAAMQVEIKRKLLEMNRETDAKLREYAKGVERYRSVIQRIAKLVTIEDIAGPDVEISVEDKLRALERQVGLKPPSQPMDPQARAQRISGGVLGDGPIVAHLVAAEAPMQRLNGDAPQLKAGARRMLRELVGAPDGYTRPQLGAQANISYKSGTFSTYLGILKNAGLAEERDGVLRATSAGAELTGPVDAPASREEIVAKWMRTLKAGARRMLEGVIQAGPDGLHRANLADYAEMQAGSGTFSTYLGILRKRGLIREEGKRIIANDMLLS